MTEDQRKKLRQKRIREWTQFVKDFPDSKLCVHAYWRLGAYCGTQDLLKASEFNRKAFRRFPRLLSVETISGRINYACSTEDSFERISRQIPMYRWFKEDFQKVLSSEEPKINGYGYYIPHVPEIYGGGQGVIRGNDPAVAARSFLTRLVEDSTKSSQRQLISLAKYGLPEIGWMILDELGDLLPADVQARIAEVMGSRGPVATRRAAEPTVEELVAQTHFEKARTVLGVEMAERLRNPDAFLPPMEPLSGPRVYGPMADTSRWIRRVLQERWWPRPDRPKDYLAGTSPRGYDSIYRHWRTRGTSFLAQSTYGWLDISLRADAAGEKDPKLERARVEWRLRRAVREYLADPQGVLKEAEFDLRPAPFGYEARIRMDGRLRRKLDGKDRDDPVEWLRRMRVRTNGTSFVLHFEPKTHRDRQPRPNRRRWFAAAP